MVTVITKTIGPSGRDYASFTLAEADVTNIGTSADLVANDEAIVFEADAGTYSEAVTFFSALTTDATRNVTYKAAAGSEHGGSKTSGVIIQGTGSTYTADIRDDYTALDGLVISQQSGSYTTHAVNSTGFSLNACIFDGESTTAGPTFFRDTGGSASDRAVISSCVSIGSLTANGNYFYTRVVGQSSYFRIINCTAIGATLGPGFTLQGRSGFDLDVEIVNCLALCPRGYRGLFSPTVAGSNNFGGSTTTQPFPVALQGSPYPITVTTDVTAASTGSQAIYVAGTGQLVFASGNDIADQGVGPSANSDVPTTGIAGETRSGATAQPGAFATLFGAPPPTPPPTQRTNLRYQIRRDTAANWASTNPVLRSGELGLETDTYKLKAGDGTSAWSALGYLGGGVTDHGAMTGLGDDDHTQYLLADGTRAMSGSLNLGGNALTNGTVSGSLLDIGSVPLNRVTGMADNTLLGNNAGVNGPPIALSAAQARAVLGVVPITVGSTAPVSPSGGDLWYHSTDQEMYAYDNSRSKWLSVTTYEAHFGRGGTLTSNHYMRGPGGFDYNTGGENGHPMRYNTTVIAAWGSAASGGTSGWNHRIMRWDDSAGANGVAASYAPSGTYTRWQKTDFNVDYDTNDLLALNMFDLGSATGVSNHTAVIAYKRRAS